MSLVTKEFAEKMNAAGWRLISEVGQSLDHALNQRTVQFFNGMLTYIVREKYHTLILGQPEESEVWSATVKSVSSEDCFLALIEKLNQEIDVSEQRKINDLQNKIDSTRRWTKQAREYLLRSKGV